MTFPRSRTALVAGSLLVLLGVSVANAQAPPSSPLGGGPPGGGRPGGLGFIIADSPEGCAQTWISIDRDGDGSVSRRDALLTVQSEFEGIGKNENGALTEETFAACEGNPVFAGALPPPGPGEVASPIEPWADEGAFAAADTSGDGAVTEEEAITAERARFVAAETELPEGDFARGSGRRFLLYDSDGDRVLTAAEWAARAEADIGHRFGRFDFDHSGEVDLDEWVLEARKVLVSSTLPDGSIDMWRFYYGF
jgi:hypothetical protein